MHPKRRRKLQIIVLLMAVGGVATALMLYALRQNIALFYTPSQVIAGDAPLNRTIRVGGVVVANSVIHELDSLEVRFQLTDYESIIDISYQGILPDLFREGQGVVTQGILLNKHHVKARQVLAKHDENYMPPEVKSTLKHQPTRKHIT